MKKLRVLAGVLVLAISIITFIPTSAHAKALISLNYLEELYEIGLSDDVIANCTPEQLNEIITQYRIDPDKVSVASSIVHFDVEDAIIQFINSSYEEKLQSGMTAEEIENANQQIEFYRQCSITELCNIFGISRTNALNFKAILDNNSSITPSRAGSIEPEEMSFDMITIDYSTIDGPAYKVMIFFNWTLRYYFDQYDDHVAVAWGGGLTQYKVDSETHISYHTMTGPFLSDWGDFAFYRMPQYTEVAVNGAGHYSFPQSYTPSDQSGEIINMAKSGNITFYIRQDGYLGKTTKVLSQYFHKMLGASFSMSASIGMTGPMLGVGITLTGSGDVSPQEQAVIDV